MNQQEFLLDSVTEIYASLYPLCYDTDRALYDMVKPYVRIVDVGGVSVVKDHMFTISLSNLLSCIETGCGIEAWMERFSSTRRGRNIEDNIRGTLNDFTSVEAIYLYDVCPSMTRVTFGVTTSKTFRPARETSDVLRPFQDVKINALSFRLREVLPQNIVEGFNRACVAKGLLPNNVMTRRNVVEFESVEKMFDFLNRSVLKFLGEGDDQTVYNALSVFDNDSMRDVKVSVVTDFGTL